MPTSDFTSDRHERAHRMEARAGSYVYVTAPGGGVTLLAFDELTDGKVGFYVSAPAGTRIEVREVGQ